MNYRFLYNSRRLLLEGLGKQVSFVDVPIEFTVKSVETGEQSGILVLPTLLRMEENQ